MVPPPLGWLWASSKSQVGLVPAAFRTQPFVTSVAIAAPFSAATCRANRKWFKTWKAIWIHRVPSVLFLFAPTLLHQDWFSHNRLDWFWMILHLLNPVYGQITIVQCFWKLLLTLSWTLLSFLPPLFFAPFPLLSLCAKRIPWSVGMVWEPSGNAGLPIEGLWGNPYNLCGWSISNRVVYGLQTSPPPFQFQETATSKSRVADTKPRTKSSRDDLAVNGRMELMGTPFLFLGVGWKFKIHVIGNNASNQLEITKSPCNESNLTVLKFCVAFVTLPTNNSLWVGRFGFLFKHLTGPPATPQILHATVLVVWTDEKREDQLYLEILSEDYVTTTWCTKDYNTCVSISLAPWFLSLSTAPKNT